MLPAAILVIVLAGGIFLVRAAARGVPGLCSSVECAAGFVRIIDFAIYMMLANIVVISILLYLVVFQKKRYK